MSRVRSTAVTRRPRKDRSSWEREGRKVGGAIGTVANAAYKGVKYLEGLINVEAHFHQSQANNTEVINTAAALQFCNIAQGDDNGSRTGNSILGKHVHFNAILTRRAATDDQVRLLMVMDKQQVSDTTPSYGEIVDNGTSNVLGRLHKSNLGRFKVLYDKIFLLDDQHPQTKIKIYRKLPKNTHFRYNGTGSTDIQRNGIYLFWVGIQTTGSGPLLSYVARTKFYDN